MLGTLLRFAGGIACGAVLAAAAPAPDPVAEARALARKGKVAEALKALEPLCLARPANVEAHRAAQDIRLQADPAARDRVVGDYRAFAREPGAGAGERYLLARILADDREALALLDEVLKADPGNRRARMARGFRLGALEDHAAAAEAYREAAKADPPWPEAYEAWVLEETARRNLEGARRAASEGLSRLPSHAVLLRTQAFVLEHDATGTFRGPGFLGETALAWYGRALAADPDDPEARLARADLASHLGRFGEATADLREMGKRAPADGRDRLLLAGILSARKDAAGAERALREAAEIPAVRDEARARLASFLVGAGRQAEALPFLPESERKEAEPLLAFAEECRYAGPDKIRAAAAGLVPAGAGPEEYLRKAALLRRTAGGASLRAAAGILEAGVAAHPRDARLAAAAGSALLKSGRTEDAIRAFGAALAEKSDPDVLYNRALARILAGRWEEAFADLAACLAARPGDGAAASWLATAAGPSGRAEEAARILEPLSARTEDHAEALGRTYLRLGRFDDAGRAAAAGIRKGGGTSSLWLVVARALRGLGRGPEAQGALSRAEAADRNTPETDLCRAQWALEDGNAAMAAASAARADAKAPGSYETLEVLARALRAGRDLAKARAAVDRAMAAFEASRAPMGPAGRLLFETAAGIYEEAGETAKAAELRSRSAPPPPPAPPDAASPPAPEPGPTGRPPASGGTPGK